MLKTINIHRLFSILFLIAVSFYCYGYWELYDATASLDPVLNSKIANEFLKSSGASRQRHFIDETVYQKYRYSEADLIYLKVLPENWSSRKLTFTGQLFSPLTGFECIKFALHFEKFFEWKLDGPVDRIVDQTGTCFNDLLLIQNAILSTGKAGSVRAIDISIESENILNDGRLQVKGYFLKSTVGTYDILLKRENFNWVVAKVISINKIN